MLSFLETDDITIISCGHKIRLFLVRFHEGVKNEYIERLYRIIRVRKIEQHTGIPLYYKNRIFFILYLFLSELKIENCVNCSAQNVCSQAGCVMV